MPEVTYRLQMGQLEREALATSNQEDEPVRKPFAPSPSPGIGAAHAIGGGGRSAGIGKGPEGLHWFGCF